MQSNYLNLPFSVFYVFCIRVLFEESKQTDIVNDILMKMLPLHCVDKYEAPYVHVRRYW